MAEKIEKPLSPAQRSILEQMAAGRKLLSSQHLMSMDSYCHWEGSVQAINRRIIDKLYGLKLIDFPSKKWGETFVTYFLTDKGKQALEDK